MNEILIDLQGNLKFPYVENEKWDEVLSVIQTLLLNGYDIKLSRPDKSVLIEFDFANKKYADNVLCWLSLDEFESLNMTSDPDYLDESSICTAPFASGSKDNDISPNSLDHIASTFEAYSKNNSDAKDTESLEGKLRWDI